MISILTILVVSLAIIITIQSSTKDSEEKTDTAAIKPSPTNYQDPTPTFTTTPFDETHPTGTSKTSTPTNNPDQPPETISDIQYPDSSVINTNNNVMELESSDDPKMITDWYKNKIKSLNMNVTSFVQTNTNNNILNKLAAADGKKEIRIEILKQNSSQIVKISASLSIDN